MAKQGEDELRRGGGEVPPQRELNRRIQTFYEQYADIYDGYHWYFHNWHLQRNWWLEAISAIDVAGGARRVLDMGCGTGNLALKFLQRGSEVVAVDLSLRMLQVLRQKAATIPNAKLVTIASDLQDFADSTRTTFDIVCECSVLHHIHDYERLVLSMARRVRPGGVLYLTREPFPPAELLPMGAVRGAISDLVERAYQKLYAEMARRFFFSFKLTAPDQSLISANFHDRGVSLERIRAVVAAEGFREISLRRWRDRETGVLSWLDNKLLRAFRRERFQKSFYSVLFRRTP